MKEDKYDCDRELRKDYHPDREFLEVHFQSRFVKETVDVGQLYDESKTTVVLLKIDSQTRERKYCWIPKKFIILRKAIPRPDDKDVGIWTVETR